MRADESKMQPLVSFPSPAICKLALCAQLPDIIKCRKTLLSIIFAAKDA